MSVLVNQEVCDLDLKESSLLEPRLSSEPRVRSLGTELQALKAVLEPQSVSQRNMGCTDRLSTE